jgi:hypothetical protein
MCARTCRGAPSIECKRGREVPVSVALRLQIRDLLLGSTDCVGTSDEAARPRLLARNDDQRSGELAKMGALLSFVAAPIAFYMSRGLRVRASAR